MSGRKARTHWCPEYAWAAALYSVLPGVQEQAMKNLEQAIGQQMGTAARPVDWSRPDDWIPQRFSGELRELALRIWTGTNRIVNPRYTLGSLLLARHNALLTVQCGAYQLTSKGQRFITGDLAVLREVDEAEGISDLLLALTEFETVRKRALLVAWAEELGGDERSESTRSSLLYERLVNLRARQLVSKAGNSYALTKIGRQYAEGLQKQAPAARRTLDESARLYRLEQRQHLRDRLGKMHPYRFEHLIQQLLMEMGYENVEVTKQSGDGGVDVLADVRFGVTSIREAIQVKRVQGSIGAPVVNELRGSLHVAKALKGTVFTLGTFTKQAKEVATPIGAPPISLVDGETLIDLLIEYSLGVTVKTISVAEVNEAFFSAQAPSVETVEAD